MVSLDRRVALIGVQASSLGEHLQPWGAKAMSHRELISAVRP